MPSVSDSQMEPVTLMTLDPGHFHAALLQKTMLPQVSPVVYVYAPPGPDLEAHLQRIAQFNSRAEAPTHWQQRVYQGPDYLDAMRRQAPGHVVVIAGVNSRKPGYLTAAVEAGFHVLIDKPVCIEPSGWQVLKAAVASAARQGLLVADIMTQRHEITHVLFRELLNTPAVFGTLRRGSPRFPALVSESVHHLAKTVAGQPLRRPVWYFDVAQQGYGLVDVSTHLVDLVLWACFPERPIDYAADIELLQARCWPTRLTLEQFTRLTGEAAFPPALQTHLEAHGDLLYACNGEIRFAVNGVHTRLGVQWHVEAPPDGGDTHVAVAHGSRSTVRIRQGKAQRYRPELYVEPAADTPASGLARDLRQTITALQSRYPGVGLRPYRKGWHVTIPDVYRVGHEAHFGQVVQTYLRYVRKGRLPDWEVPNMLARYYITTQALALAQGESPDDRTRVLT